MLDEGAALTPGEESILSALNKELHDMAQPLTSLQCRLELGKLLGDAASVAEAVDGALLELDRVNRSFSRIRAVLASSGNAPGKP